MNNVKLPLRKRFRGFLPVVVDVETSGFDPNKNAILEIALIPIMINKDSGIFEQGKSLHFHIKPFDGAILDEKALEFNQIKPDHPFRFAEEEEEVLLQINNKIDILLKENNCSKAILIGHNSHFDLYFLNAAYSRNNIRSRFHSFSSFDTATLAALAYGETVLAKAMYKAQIKFNPDEAHSALYDTEKTAELFCKIMNSYKMLSN